MNQHQIMYCCCCISIYVSIHRTITLQITRPWLGIIYKLTLVGVIKHPILIQEQYDVTDGYLTICRKSGWFISLSKRDINQEPNHELKILLFFFLQNSIRTASYLHCCCWTAIIAFSEWKSTWCCQFHVSSSLMKLRNPIGKLVTVFAITDERGSNCKTYNLSFWIFFSKDSSICLSDEFSFWNPDEFPNKTSIKLHHWILV